MLILALGGLKESGKDTFASYLEEAVPNTRILGMSSALNDTLIAVDPIVDTDGQRYSDYIEKFGYVEAKKHPEVRRLQIALGEQGRSLYPDLWVDPVRREFHPAKSSGVDLFIVSGIRNHRELRMATLAQAHTVFVERPEREAKMGERATQFSTDSTETTLNRSHFDSSIINTEEDFRSDTLKWFAQTFPEFAKECGNSLLTSYLERATTT